MLFLTSECAENFPSDQGGVQRQWKQQRCVRGKQMEGDRRNQVSLRCAQPSGCDVAQRENNKH
jgi:hypothetical protein